MKHIQGRFQKSIHDRVARDELSPLTCRGIGVQYRWDGLHKYVQFQVDSGRIYMYIAEDQKCSGLAPEAVSGWDSL